VCGVEAGARHRDTTQLQARKPALQASNTKSAPLNLGCHTHLDAEKICHMRFTPCSTSTESAAAIVAAGADAEAGVNTPSYSSGRGVRVPRAAPEASGSDMDGGRTLSSLHLAPLVERPVMHCCACAVPLHCSDVLYLCCTAAVPSTLCQHTHLHLQGVVRPPAPHL
jgi:hypothetical protein